MIIAQSKSSLAKLLATENINVRRNANAQTASFDIKNRVLELPVWKGVSEDLEDMLLVHETGHALDTPWDGWIKAADNISKKYHDNVTNRHKMAVKGFLNVIEDARIDKRQKRRYPGSRQNYLAGYKELMERGFFGPPNKDLNTYNFIDRLNVYFKGGFATIKFSPEEMPYVKRVENAETFEDVIKLTDEIYAYCKSKGENEQTTPNDIGDSEDEYEYGSETDDDYDMDGEDGDGDDAEDGEGGDGENGEDGEGNDDLDKAGSSQDQDQDKGEDFVPESQTEKLWEEKQKELTNSDIEFVYVTVPKTVISNIVDDYKVVLKENNEYNLAYKDKPYLKENAVDFAKYKSDENSSISFMVKEFEMKKSADLYSKISIAKTGVIDTNKLHSYKYNDDIFRRVSIVPQGKNHGFIMFLDWSGSMSPELRHTIKQLLSMVLFCKRVQIPFEVYLFRDLNKKEQTQIVNQNHFEYKTGDMSLRGFKMRNVLSSRMSLVELNNAFVNMWCLSSRGSYNPVEPMNGTPLNAAIIVAAELVNQFRARNKLQIVNTIFLTDGGSNPIEGIVGSSVKAWRKKKYIVQDEITRKDYYCTNTDYGSIDGSEVTNTLLRILKQRTGCNLIGFYLHSQYTKNLGYIYESYFGNRISNEKHYQEMDKCWKTNKFVPVTSSGYDEYYIINLNSMKEVPKELHVDGSMTKGKIAKVFLSFSESKAINRVLLQRFIKSISNVAKVG